MIVMPIGVPSKIESVEPKTVPVLVIVTALLPTKRPAPIAPFAMIVPEFVIPPVMIAAVELWMPIAAFPLTWIVPEFVMPLATWSATAVPPWVKPTVMPAAFPLGAVAAIVPEFAIPPPTELGVAKAEET